MNLVERVKAPTPKFFRVLRSIGLALLAISGSVIAAPVVLPAVVVSVAGYTALAGGIISAISQVTMMIPPSDRIRRETTQGWTSKMPLDKIRIS